VPQPWAAAWWSLESCSPGAEKIFGNASHTLPTLNSTGIPTGTSTTSVETLRASCQVRASGQRAVAGHAEAARVVDDDKVDAAGFLALGANAGAGAADDRLARRDLAAEPLQDVGSM